MYTVGHIHGKFICEESIPLNEIAAHLYVWRHLPSGAQVLKVASSDAENVFCLYFPTLPDSSNGAPHILEHVVLCGSKKYQIKDPFFSMTRRSLATFLNAFTGDDFTCYPAASENRDDFYNLLDVYLDAAFFPNIDRLSFLQEGHHLGFENDDPNGALEWRGVVFNEMEGSFTSPERRLFREINAKLVPDQPYAKVSGGDPIDIPSLTHEQLVAYHKKYYAPGSCTFYFYGNLPIEEQLDFINDRVLKDAPLKASKEIIPLQKRFHHPVIAEARFPFPKVPDIDSQYICSFSWLTVPSDEHQTVLALDLLTHILLGTDASPLKRALIESPFATDVSGYYSADDRESSLHLICMGCTKESHSNLLNIIHTTLKKVVEEGIDPNAIAANLHQLELDRTEISGGSYPYGLALFFRAVLGMRHGCPPEKGLLIHSLFTELRDRLKSPHYLTDLIKKYILNNPHAVFMTMVPDVDLAEIERTQKKERLTKIQDSLSPQDKEQILAQTKELAAYHEETKDQDISMLPQFPIDKVPAQPKDYALHRTSQGDVTLYTHETFTNNITSASIYWNMPELSDGELVNAGLLFKMLTSLGVGKRSYVENLQYAESIVSGISFSQSMNWNAQSPNLCKPMLSIGGKSFASNETAMIQFFREIAADFRTDEIERIEQLLDKHATGLSKSLMTNAMNYATTLAGSSLSPQKALMEKWSGLTHVKDVLPLSTAAGRGAQLSESFARLKKKLFTSPNPDVVITANHTSIASLKAHDAIWRFSGKAHTSWDGMVPKYEKRSGAIAIASPVAFNAKALLTVPSFHTDAGALMVASELLENLSLHPLIREQGGAYGSGIQYSGIDGVWTFYSYRDPNIAKTFDIFDQSIHDLLKGDFHEQNIVEAKLSLIRRLDAVVKPALRGALAYSMLKEERTFEMRQHLRQSILNASKEEILKAVTTHIAPKLEDSVEVSFAGKELLEKEGKHLPILHAF